MSSAKQKPVQLPAESEAQLQELVDKTHSPSMALKLWEKLSRDERARLGGDVDAAIRDHGSAGALYAAIYGCESPAESVVKAAAKLRLIDGDQRAELLQDIYLVEGHRGAGVVPVLDGLPERIETDIKKAKTDYRLVLVEGSGIRWMFWDGQYLDIDWSSQSKAWEFLWELARAASGGIPLDRNCLASSEKVSIKERSRGLRDALRKSEALKKISKSFIELLMSEEKDTYRIDLPKSQIWQRRVTRDGWEVEMDDAADHALEALAAQIKPKNVS